MCVYVYIYICEYIYTCVNLFVRTCVCASTHRKDDMHPNILRQF